LAKALSRNIHLKEIYLDDNKIGFNGIKALSEKVLGKVSLIKINLSHNLIDEDGASCLGKCLETASSLQILYLNSNNIKNKGCVEISKGLEKNNSLVELHLDNNKISDQGVNALSKVLKGKENLMFLGLSTNEITEIDDDFKSLFHWVQTIKIADNPLYPSAIMALFQETKSNRLFKKLRFKTNELFLFKSIGENDNLKTFDLSYNDKINISLIKSILSLKNISKLIIPRNDIHDKDIQRISQYVKDFNSPLKELNIQSNSIGIEGSLAIADLIKDNEYLKVLNITDNPLMSEGINNICDSICNNKNVLNELLINDTKCNDFCVGNIVKMLKNNQKLIIFTFIGNKFTNKGIDKILSVLRINNTLKQISLGNRYINSEAFLNLSDYLSFNKSLLILEIKSSKLNDDILKKLSKILVYNNELINIHLVDNWLTYEGIVYMGQYLNKNKSINQIKVLLNANRDEEGPIKSSNPHIIFN
jgi:Ran GTPase-activating protein (RanGAP) involved in mRNA processing and transport